MIFVATPFDIQRVLNGLTYKVFFFFCIFGTCTKKKKKKIFIYFHIYINIY
jgi:hypothetical protein